MNFSHRLSHLYERALFLRGHITVSECSDCTVILLEVTTPLVDLEGCDVDDLKVAICNKNSNRLKGVDAAH